MMKVGILRERNLNAWEMQNFIPLRGRVDLTAFAPADNRYDLSGIGIPVERLDPAGEWMARALHPLDALGRWAGARGEQRHYYPGELLRKAAGLDILHTVDLKSRMTYTGAWLKARRGISLVVTEWENIPFLHEEKRRWANMWRRSMEAADRVIAVTEGTRRKLLLEGIPETRISVIPYGVDITHFSPRPRDIAWREDRGIGRECPVVLFVGRFVYEKGVQTLLAAAGDILRDPRQRETGLTFVLIGAGEETGAMRRRVAGWGLQDRIILIPHISYADLPRAYNAADIFVLPSIPLRGWMEQFGMVLAEALASGLPVVGSQSGSIPEVIGEAGLTVPPGDFSSLARVLVDLLAHEGKRAELSAAGRGRAVERYAAARVAEGIQRVYEDVRGRAG